MNDFAVHAENLERRFGHFVAVNRISFNVKRGEIYGFLGANGAGKSTTIRMLCGLLEPSGGDATVAGFSVRTDPEEVKKRLGYMSQKFALYPTLTVDENMEFYAGLYGLERPRTRERMKAVATLVELDEHRSRLVKVLPGGIRQRVALACALLHEPEIVFLDEPTAGVDPLLRRRFWEIIDGLSAAGTTVFVTTHYMDEVEHCHRLALMNAGVIVSEGTVAEMKRAAFPAPLLELETERIVEAFETLAEEESRLGDVAMHGATIHIVPRTDAVAALSLARELLSKKHIAVLRSENVEPGMEDVFVRMVKTHET